MYNLLIVDDEIEILQWLEELFRYDCREELEVYTAGSGKKAISILNQVKFDIILTDIKMPGMDGVELYRHIKENWPKARVVFLTGFRDHQALYEIANDKEVRYLLKTEGDRKILDTVEEVICEIRKQMEEYALEEHRHAMFTRARYWLQKEFLERLISGEGTQQVTGNELAEVEIPLNQQYPMLAYLGKIEDQDKTGPDKSPYGIKEDVLSVVMENMPRILHVYGCVLESSYLFLLIQPRMADRNIDWKRIYHISAGALEDIQCICLSRLGVKLPFTISMEAVLLDQAGEQYHYLKSGLVTILKEEEPGILRLDGKAALIPKENDILQVDSKMGLMKLPMLNSYLESGMFEECRGLLKEITLPLLTARSRHDMGALELYLNVSMIFLKAINLNQLNDKLPFQIGLYKLTSVEEFRDWNEAVTYLQELSEILFGLLDEKQGYHKDQAILRVEDYIRRNLKNDLTLTTLAEVGGFNASYLSRLFKLKYKCNLSEYIIRERMNLAKELLAQTNEKINRVGEEVGYGSAHSFIRVFKGSEGISPGEYRNRYRGEE